nr:unnamed protein product [Callosobruchus chinensis]
MPLLPYV